MQLSRSEKFLSNTGYHSFERDTQLENQGGMNQNRIVIFDSCTDD